MSACTHPNTEPDMGRACAETMEVADIGDLILAATGTRYKAIAKGRLLTRMPAHGEGIAAQDLIEPDIFNAVIDRLAVRYPAGTDRRALVSYWSLFYLSTLIIGPTLCWLTMRRILPLGLSQTSLIIDPTTATPRAFLLPHIGRVEDDLDVFKALSPVVREHLEPLIPALAKHCGLSPKVLWTNTAAYLSWVVGEVGRQSGAELEKEGSLLLDSPQWPDGWRNPFHRAIRIEPNEKGEPVAHRRVCCLRYAVPGVGGCGATCPVPEGRATL